MTERGHWVYAITDHRVTEDLSWLTGVAAGKVRPVRAAGLTVLGSDVDLAEFGADALRRNLEDQEWLERVARAHHHVVDAAARLFPLLPLGLATVYSSEASIQSAVAERRQTLLAALDQVRGRMEWGVKAFAQPEPRQRVTATRAGGSSKSPGGGAGLAYLKQRGRELDARFDAQRTAAASARAVHAELAGQAAGARLHRPQSPQLSGTRAPMLLNAAYLLGQDDGRAFASAVTSLASAHPNLQLELTGPWPPYSFATDVMDTDVMGTDAGPGTGDGAEGGT